MAELVPKTLRSSVDRLRNEIDHTFNQFLGRVRPEDDNEDILSPTRFLRTGTPPVDVEEKGNEILVTAELPGMKKDDFNVELSGDRLIIRGEKKSEREENREGYYLSECTYGHFSRSIPLPAKVQEDKVKADYKNGVLKVRLPKSDDYKTKNINVQTS